MMLKPNWTDEKMENVIANLLRAGVLLSAAVVLLGGILYLVRHGESPVNYRVFRGEPPELRRLSGIIQQAFALRAAGIIQLGLVLLIATPVARVAFSALGFAAEKDRMYEVFTLIVLVILLYSVTGPGLGP